MLKTSEIPVPPHETERLQALERYAVLDSLPERGVDDLAQLAAQICGTPMALVSLIDRHRQWFKAKVGVEQRCEVSREHAFCHHTIQQTGPLVVTDARADVRFATNLLVIGEPFIRFYAGVPLVTPDGYPLGTLCVLDRVPRALEPAQIEALQALARQVISQFELRRHRSTLSESLILQQELQKSRERFDLAVQGSNDGLWDWDVETDTVYFSPRWKSMLGHAEHEIRGQFDEWETRLHPEDRERALATVHAYFEGKTPLYELEHRLRHKDGSYRWILARGLALRDGSGKPYRMAGSHTDLTARKRAEAELRESEERFRSAFDYAPIGMALVSPDGGWLKVNRAICEMVGYREEDLLATDFQSITHPEDLTADLEYVRQMLAGERETYQMEKRYVHKRGHIVWVLLSVSLVRTADGAPRYFISQIQNITERKRAERELVAAKEAAEAASQAKGEFLANMSHEIRTPMNGVLGMVNLLLDTDLSEEQRRFAAMMRSAARSLLAVLNDILDFSKIEARGMTLESVDLDVRQIIEEVAGLLHEGACEKNIKLSRLVPDNLPSPLQGDPTRLRQVLLNLVSNAVKFTHGGEVVVQATHRGETDHEVALRFTVRDTGIGIAPEAQARLFAPFVQADGSMTRKFGGTGLGLTISKRLVELMGGEIGFESVIGEGTTFWFDVTLKRSLSQGQAPSASRNGRDAPGDVSDIRLPHRARVLVVEDNDLNQFVLVRLLEKLGCEAMVVPHGRAALEAMERTQYTAVLMDCQMPEMDGYEATREIRRREAGQHHTPIIAMTAHAMEGAREQCLSAGMDDYLTKPVELDALRGTLAQWLAVGGRP